MFPMFRQTLAVACATLLVCHAVPAFAKVAEVNQLSLAEAAENLPVKLLGVITYCDQREGRAFIQDETGGVFFHPPPPVQGQPEIKAGELVEIVGVTWRGRYSPSIAGDPADESILSLASGVKPVRLKIVGEGVLPVPQQASVDRIKTGEFHNQFVTVRGTIQQVRIQEDPGWSGIRVELGTRHGSIIALVKRKPGESGFPTDWGGNEAEVTAVVAGTGDEFDRFVDPWLAVESTKQIIPDFEASQLALSQPVQSFRNLLQYAPTSKVAGRERVRVNGIVTMVKPGYGYFLGNTEGGIWVEVPLSPILQPGDSLDMAAYPARRDWQVYLVDPLIRILKHNEILPPRPAAVEQAAAGNEEAALVEIHGQLVDQLVTPYYMLFFLEASGLSYSARLDLPEGTREPPALEVGSWVSLTGICETGKQPKPGENPKMAFSLLLRSSSDVTVLRHAPWLNARKLRWLLAAVGFGLLLAFAWIALLRKQVGRQTRAIAREMSERTTIEERQRIARELHDTLEQELAGVNMHLDAAADWVVDMPPRIVNAITRAREMLQHSRAEARRSILDLRSLTLEKLGLAGSLREMVTAFESTTPHLSLEVSGKVRRLEPQVEFHLLRISQEVTNNAIKHANADHISIVLEFLQETVRLTITDDGVGFDPPTANPSRFGLRGIRERAGKISANFSLVSKPGQGVCITITIPNP